MASKRPLVLYTSPSNKVQEIVSSDSIDPDVADLTSAFVGVDDAQTLTQKTLTEPRISLSQTAGTVGAILDTSGNNALAFRPATSAVNYLQVRNSATAAAVELETAGGDANVTLNVKPKGSGELQINGAAVTTASNTQTLTGKTLSGDTLSECLIDTSIVQTNPAGTYGTLRDPTNSKLLILTASGSPTTCFGLRNQTGTANTMALSIVDVSGGTVTRSHMNLVPIGSDGRVKERTVNLSREPDPVTPTDYIDVSGGASWFPLGVTAGIRGGAAGEGPVTATGTVYYIPFFAPRRGVSVSGSTGTAIAPVMSALAVCTASAVAAGGNIRFGIYNNNSSTLVRPSTLVHDSGTIVIANTNDLVVSYVPASGITLVGGSMYWLAFAVDNTTTELVLHGYDQPMISLGSSVANNAGAAGAFNTTNATFYVGYSEAVAFGALPATASVGSLIFRDAMAIPVILAKWSA